MPYTALACIISIARVTVNIMHECYCSSVISSILSGLEAAQSTTARGETTSGSAEEIEILHLGMLYTE